MNPANETLYTGTRPCRSCGAPERYIPGARLRELREKTGLTLTEVARRMGVSKSYLSDMELGHRDVTEEQAEYFWKAIR